MGVAVKVRIVLTRLGDPVGGHTGILRDNALVTVSL